jgi:hypothetical protein
VSSRQQKARRLGRLVNGLARSQHGSVLVTDSARTPPGVTDAFLAELDVAVHCHRWGGPREDNPYLGYLGLAEQFVVTADSMSMIAEALFAAKPLFLFQSRRRSALVAAALQLPLQCPGAPAGDGDRAAAHASRHRTDNRAPRGRTGAPAGWARASRR